MFEINRSPTAAELRKFGLTMLGGFLVIGAVLWIAPWIRTRDVGALGWTAHSAKTFAVIAWALGVAFGVVGFSPISLARPVYVAWMTVATKLGVVMSTLLLSVLFWIILPVFSLIVRMGDPLRKKLFPGGTYWETYKPHEATLERMRRPF